MVHQTGLSLIEILITLLILGFTLLCVLGDGIVRQKNYRVYVEQLATWERQENKRELIKQDAP